MADIDLAKTKGHQHCYQWYRYNTAILSMVYRSPYLTILAVIILAAEYDQCFYSSKFGKGFGQNIIITVRLCEMVSNELGLYKKCLLPISNKEHFDKNHHVFCIPVGLLICTSVVSGHYEQTIKHMFIYLVMISRLGCGIRWSYWFTLTHYSHCRGSNLSHIGGQFKRNSTETRKFLATPHLEMDIKAQNNEEWSIRGV